MRSFLRPGFLLLEVMITLAVLVAFAGVVGQVQSYLVQTHHDATECLQSVTRIRSAIEHARAHPDEHIETPFSVTPLVLEPRVMREQFEVATRMPDLQFAQCSLDNAHHNDSSRRWLLCVIS